MYFKNVCIYCAFRHLYGWRFVTILAISEIEYSLEVEDTVVKSIT